MTRRIGIIPAAGKAERFGGIMKELLPLPDGVSFLFAAVERLLFCDEIIVVTSLDKIQQHAHEVGSIASYVVQSFQNDIMGAIISAIRPTRADRYYFTMPDTFVSHDVFTKAPAAHFAMGTFETDTPERFGCIVGNEVVNKVAVPTLAKKLGTFTFKAWGVFTFSNRVADAWRQMPNEATYTEAINSAIQMNGGVTTWDIGDYHDNASMEDYRRLLCQ